MQSQQILTKAIEKAIANGWKSGPGFQWESRDEFITFDSGLDCPDKWHKFKANELLFNHDFAKALWGEYAPEADTSIYGGSSVGSLRPSEPWKTHLQQMVIAEDPIAYLGQNI